MWCWEFLGSGITTWILIGKLDRYILQIADAPEQQQGQDGSLTPYHSLHQKESLTLTQSDQEVD